MKAHARIFLVAGFPLVAFGCNSTASPTSGRTDEEAVQASAAACEVEPGVPPEGTTLNENRLPTGDYLTPLAAPGASLLKLNPGMPAVPNFLADHAASTAVSPDGRTLLVLTSGYNETNWIPTTAPSPGVIGYENPAESGEWVFVYDIAANGRPIQKQVLSIPNSFSGIAFNPSGTEFYVGGGQDDNLHVFDLTSGTWAETTVATDAGTTPFLAFNHGVGLGLENYPETAGLAVTADGTKVVVANYENDSISIVTLATKTFADLDLRPGKAASSPATGVAGGEYPFWVAIKGNTTAYVSSHRDEEVDVVDLTLSPPAVTARIPVGRQPNKMILNKDQSSLFVANGNDDTVSVIDTASNTVSETLSVVAPTDVFDNPAHLKGANPNGLALSPDERTLYVTDGATNAVAVVELDPFHAKPGATVGLIPTGWYPTAVATSANGHFLYVTNAKSIPRAACEDILTTAWGPVGTLNGGPTDGGGPTTDQHCWNGNEYVWQLETAGLLSAPTPSGPTLAALTEQVALNDHFGAAHAAPNPTMAFLKEKIRHVIYIIKENRTFDQILGDLGNGSNGDPALTMFPKSVTPNFHALAENFVTLDNFLDTGETSGVGWNWTTAAHTTDQIERTQPINYGKGGFTYDWEGTNRNINVGIATLGGRLAADPLTPQDPDLLPGAHDVASASAPGPGTAYLWDGALAAGLTVRNYGALCDLARYSLAGTPYAVLYPPLDHHPFTTGHQQAWPAAAGLQNYTDTYFRAFDQAYPDYWRYEEWYREFSGFVATHTLPSLEIVRLPHDHTGSYGASEATSGLGTPLLEVADNDAAVGALVAAVAASPYATSTLIFIIEDDAQDGPDHVSAHRSTTFVAGPYVKQGKVISAAYDTISLVRTIEDVLGIRPLGMYDALATPMNDVFDTRLDPSSFRYTATSSGALSGTSALTVRDRSRIHEYYAALKSGHDSAYWERVMKGQNFAREDDLDVEKFNRALWVGLMGSKPYPSIRTGTDERTENEELLYCPVNLNPSSHT